MRNLILSVVVLGAMSSGCASAEHHTDEKSNLHVSDKVNEIGDVPVFRLMNTKTTPVSVDLFIGADNATETETSSTEESDSGIDHEAWGPQVVVDPADYQPDEEPENCTSPVYWFIDNDGDRAGDRSVSPLHQCDEPWPGKSVPNGLDCDDTTSDIRPGADELCDGIDNNCDGNIDEGCNTPDPDPVEEVVDPEPDPNPIPDPEECLTGTDCDGDGFVGVNDCDEENPAVHSFQTEDCNDGIDNNCDGFIDSDDASCEVVGSDPEPIPDPVIEPTSDSDPTPVPDPDPTPVPDPDPIPVPDPEPIPVPDPDPTPDPEPTPDPIPDPVMEDEDGDGFNVEDDCDDLDSTTYPGAIEVCDFIDNDCNGFVDDGIQQERFIDIDGDGFGQTIGVMTCQLSDPKLVTVSGDCDDINPDINPDADEVCGDEVDQDCDQSDMVCPEPEQVCDLVETCDDGIDNDCNGQVDEGCYVVPGPTVRCDGQVVCLEDQDEDGHDETACIDAALFTQGSLFRNESAYALGYNAFGWDFVPWDLYEPTEDGYFCLDFTNKPSGISQMTMVSSYARDGITLIEDANPGQEVWMQNYGFCTSNTDNSLEFCNYQGNFNYLLAFSWDGQELSGAGNL